MFKAASCSPIVYLEDTEDNGGGFSATEKSILLGKRDSVSACGLGTESKRFKLSEHDVHQQEEERLVNMSMGMVPSPSPLGLSLRKSLSFAELIEARLCQERQNIHPTETVKESRRGRPKKEAEKFKASRWNAKLLRIGYWERRAVRDQELVAKCYYQKRKFVWEMLDGKLKRKMEIQWSDITAIRVAFPENSNAVLEIEVKTAPLFFQETTPQPRKQSGWQTSSDFTGFQATWYRMHHLQFEEGTLQPHYEKLLQCDKRLFMLSQKPFSMHRSPYLHRNMSEYQNSASGFNNLQQRVTPNMQFSPHGIKQPSYFSSHQPQMYRQRVHPWNPTYIASPLSVMGFPRTENHGGNYCVDPQRTLIRGGMTNWDNHYVATEYQARPMVVQPVPVQYSSSSENGIALPRPLSPNSLLKDIDNQLNDPSTSSCTDKEKLMARVNSMYNLLGLLQEQAPINNATDTSGSEYSHGTSNITVSSILAESDESEGSMPQESEPDIGANENPDIGRNSSFSNLFEELEDYVSAGFAMG